MKRNGILSLLIFASYITAHAQKLPTHTEQYTFLNTYLKKSLKTALADSLINIENEQSNLSALYKIKSNFKLSKADQQFIRKQVVFNKRIYTLDSAKLEPLPWKKSGENELATWISLPVFSVNRKIAFIRKRYYCGSCCGQDGYSIYLKIKGKWKESNYDPPQMVY